MYELITKQLKRANASLGVLTRYYRNNTLFLVLYVKFSAKQTHIKTVSPRIAVMKIAYLYLRNTLSLVQQLCYYIEVILLLAVNLNNLMMKYPFLIFIRPIKPSPFPPRQHC